MHENSSKDFSFFERENFLKKILNVNKQRWEMEQFEMRVSVVSVPTECVSDLG